MRLPRIQEFEHFCKNIFLDPFINETSVGHSDRVGRIKKMRPEQLVKPLTELTQPTL